MKNTLHILVLLLSARLAAPVPAAAHSAAVANPAQTALPTEAAQTAPAATPAQAAPPAAAHPLPADPPGREHLRLDAEWKFSLGHFGDYDLDYGHGTGYFTWYAKAGYGDGPASPRFDDRPWRTLDLPHDWAVELPFSGEASHSHGYKTIGWKYPATSVGWYRKSFRIPESDLGRRISIQFDGVYRNAIVWCNGFYLGQEPSGYIGFEYDISDYLNYGGDNVIAVRADASLEEGWFYEGAGIYRHVWLNKTDPLHVAPRGIFVYSGMAGDTARVTARATVINAGRSDADLRIEQAVADAGGRIVARAQAGGSRLAPLAAQEYACELRVTAPRLWSPEAPHLYTLITRVYDGARLTDRCETRFGIRTLRFDASQGLLLNGQPLKLRGTNNHQDHAGVGAALPDALQRFRIARLKAMGSNAYRCSHNPPTPELLDACDELGMLVIDENRLMGSTAEHFDWLQRLITRDRNHPSVLIWSLGNEEWAIESNIKGARLTDAMQRFAQSIDPTRPCTVAISGGCGQGSSEAIQVMGFNYLAQCDIDTYHRNYPAQPGVGTEETTGSGTRGIYSDDRANGHIAQYDRLGGTSVERGCKFYAERPWLAGLFYWTGFDYKGEPNPLSWPAVGSQYGLLDACGFPKDSYYYLQSQWREEPVLHLLPHWNWSGHEGEVIRVWAYSNCDVVELILNGRSLGRKPIPRYGHGEWEVPYAPGRLAARGFRAGKEVCTAAIETSGPPALLQLEADRTDLRADGADLAVVTLRVSDARGRTASEADAEVTFSLQGPGRIIGVGNGDPASHEPDRFCETVTTANIHNLEELVLESLEDGAVQAAAASPAAWKAAFRSERNADWRAYQDSLIAVRGTFSLEGASAQTSVTLFAKCVVEDQAILINGHPIAAGFGRDDQLPGFRIDPAFLHAGANECLFLGKRFRKRYQWDEPNTDPGVVQLFTPAAPWKRRAFNGVAQVLVQAGDAAGEITLTAAVPGLAPALLRLRVQEGSLQPAAK
ncbi:MAG TPA: beta-galactosidase GalA [bacterium]|nr:beta-galactosidase GalA [bacterium]